MPKKITYYRCEICDKQYLDEKAAITCEQKHFIPKTVDMPIYNHKDNKIEYPESVLVHFERDGKKSSARYYRKQLN